MKLTFGDSALSLDRPVVMGVLNCTPDSFSDGGQFVDTALAVDHAQQMIADGAAIIDIGGESTRPGAAAVPLAEELGRVIPVIEAIRQSSDIPLSVDTCKPEVMRAAIAAGASMINDVTALAADGAIDTVAELRVPVCLMHMQGIPRTMQEAPQYDDVVAELVSFLQARADACVAGGIERDRIVIDPGFGFGKTLEHNLTLLKELPKFVALGYPVLAGLSRKSMIGMILNRPVDERLAGSLALALLAAQGGAHIIRVHDVRETTDVLTILGAV